MALDIFLSDYVVSFIKCHVRSVRKDDIIPQRHLRDGILKAQGHCLRMSIFFEHWTVCYDALLSCTG